jgi:hypothetical protein
MIETPTTKIRRTTSHTFHQAPHVREKETTSKAQGEQGKLEPLIRWLKNTTGFRLQQTQNKARTCSYTEQRHRTR